MRLSIGDALSSAPESKDSPSSLPCSIRKVLSSRSRLLSPSTQSEIDKTVRSTKDSWGMIVAPLVMVCSQPRPVRQRRRATNHSAATKSPSPRLLSPFSERVREASCSEPSPSTLCWSTGRLLARISCVSRPVPQLHQASARFGSILGRREPGGMRHRCVAARVCDGSF